MLYHDMTNDYRDRDYRITITLQDGYYKGQLYYDYQTGGTMGHGLHFDTIEHIYHYFQHLSYFEDEYLEYDDHTGGFQLENNCAFTIDKDDIHVHFTLHDDDGNTLNKTILKYNLALYIVSIAITKCTGHGVKRDSRKCIMCKHYCPIEGTASGICSYKNRKVSRGTTICKYGFRPVKE